MSIYVARSPYRSYSSSNRRGFKLPSFPLPFKGLLKRRQRLSRSIPVSAAVRRRSGSGDSMGAMASAAAAATVQSAGTVKKLFHSVRDKKLRFEFGPGTIIVGLGVIAITMTLAYLLQFNKVATKGYDLRRLEAARQQLMNQYDIKNMKMAQAKSLAVIRESDKVGTMRKPNHVEFVRGNTALASK